ncbi:MAG: hypothetical protein MOB07_02760 [Acidobacteria bacterium]|nr:hypothetical protein [Acidobacteriota bacterium]
MSQTAIFSGLYEEVRDYAELLDKVLVELKGGISQPQDEKRKKLGRFLTELGSKHTRSLAVRLIGRLLRSEGQVTPQELAKIGSKLNSSETPVIDQTMISQLEELARSLEQEQAVAMARMRGKEL